jgi:ribonuclease HI
MEVNIWTDGSCNNNTKFKTALYGGWAFIAKVDDDLIHEDLNYKEETTSTQMEMIAVIEALKYSNKVFKGRVVNIHSDSAMVVNCFHQRWYDNWENNSYVNVKNEELWKEMITLVHSKVNKVRFVKVKGHAGIEENERVDFLAGEARKYILEEKGLT